MFQVSEIRSYACTDPALALALLRSSLICAPSRVEPNGIFQSSITSRTWLSQELSVFDALNMTAWRSGLIDRCSLLVRGNRYLSTDIVHTLGGVFVLMLIAAPAQTQCCGYIASMHHVPLDWEIGASSQHHCLS
ncbi:hypothetical protein AcV7_001661 [Taiwanofungus camphoratus]|nr:hypothetical protein AcV7_001661 [Antrodia cinnamomea]